METGIGKYEINPMHDDGLQRAIAEVLQAPWRGGEIAGIRRSRTGLSGCHGAHMPCRPVDYMYLGRW